MERDNYARIVICEHSEEKLVSNTEKLISGHRIPSKEEKIEFWKSFSFHEFVQRPMMWVKGENERPNKEDYKIGAKLLPKIIEILEIQKVIFLSSDKTRFELVKNSLGNTKDLFIGENKIDDSLPRIIEIQNQLKTKIYFVKHPSSYSSLDLWHKFISEN